MREHKAVTPEMIDDELVNAIYASPIFLDNTHEGSNKTIDSEYIRAVLAYLANNPVVPNEDEKRRMSHAWMISSESCEGYWAAIEWQRRAYLKKEPELPEEVKNLLWKANPYPNTGAENRHDEAVKAAYALGLKNGGKK